jgi:hypothetical protein
MNRYKLMILLFFVSLMASAQKKGDPGSPGVSGKVVFEEKNGVCAVEAEHYYKQTLTEVRKWYRITAADIPIVSPDPDQPHLKESSGDSYVEILPDTRVTSNDKLVPGENFSNEPGKMGVLHYKVKINTPGRYFIWVRSYSEGAEDNGLHVGLDGIWPEHGQRMQWCEGKNEWTWASKQRTQEVHCGVPGEIYLDILQPGIHEITFSMREDGFEMDKFILVLDPEYKPVGKGPDPELLKGKLKNLSTVN